MKVTSVQYVFTFKDLEKDIKCEGESRMAVITSAILTWVEYRDPPEDDPNGERFSLDYKFRGWGCTSTGKISQRQKYESPQAFSNFMQMCKFLLELISINSAQKGLLNAVIAKKMRIEVQVWLAQAKQRQQKDC